MTNYMKQIIAKLEQTHKEKLLAELQHYTCENEQLELANKKLRDEMTTLLEKFNTQTSMTLSEEVHDLFKENLKLRAESIHLKLAVKLLQLDRGD